MRDNEITDNLNEWTNRVHKIPHNSKQKSSSLGFSKERKWTTCSKHSGHFRKTENTIRLTVKESYQTN
jgi:hypothetical protein